MLARADACVLIGDIGMTTEGEDLYVMDMGEAWTGLTGKPFVWAAWIGNDRLTPELSGYLQAPLEYYGAREVSRVASFSGSSQTEVNHRRQEAVELGITHTGWTRDMVRDYYDNVMVYAMDDRMLTAKLAIVLIVVACLGVWLWMPRGADAKSREFYQAIQTRDWGRIYDLAGKKEKTLEPWHREEFVALMRDLSSNWPADIGKLTINLEWALRETERVYTYRFNARLSDVLGKPTRNSHYLNVSFYSDEEGWHPQIADLPVQVNFMGRIKDKKRMAVLLESCQRAHVPALIRMYDKREMSVERLALYLKGELPFAEVSRPLQGP